MTEHLRSVQDPIYHPWPTAVKAFVGTGESAHGRLYKADVLGSVDVGQIWIEADEVLKSIEALCDQRFHMFLITHKFIYHPNI